MIVYTLKYYMIYALLLLMLVMKGINRNADVDDEYMCAYYYIS